VKIKKNCEGTEVRINNSKYILVDLTVGKLEHILQLAEYEKTSYINCIKNYSEEELKNYGMPFLNCIEEKIRLISEEIMKR